MYLHTAVVKNSTQIGLPEGRTTATPKPHDEYQPESSDWNYSNRISVGECVLGSADFCQIVIIHLLKICPSLAWCSVNQSRERDPTTLGCSTFAASVPLLSLDHRWASEARTCVDISKYFTRFYSPTIHINTTLRSACEQISPTGINQITKVLRTQLADDWYQTE